MLSAAATAQPVAPAKELGVVLVTSGQPSSLPTQIPTTMESVTALQLSETINATDSEDALKYLPSLSVRKRYIGDYNHAVLASRASGANNPARSAVYVDGMLLSNYLGNAATYAPRWGLVTPEEIERVDVMYGPFSAAYPGNSVGAVVDYVTRMPQTFEAHMKVSAFNQRFDAYNTDSHFGGANASASLGSKVGDWSYWFNVNRLDSSGQPMMFMRDTAQRTGVVAGSMPVNGVASAISTTGASAADVLGTTTQYRTVQDHIKLKLAYDLSSTVRASYTLGYWQNRSDGNPSSYLTSASTGASVYTGTVNNGVNTYTVPAFTASQEALTHVIHGLSLKTRTQDVFDWEVTASLYDYQTDVNRASGNKSSDTTYANAGKITDQNGSGWNNLAFKGTWRPEGLKGPHVVDFGYQQDNYTLKTITQNTATHWESAAPTSLASKAGGSTHMQSLYLQDAWRLAPSWKTVVGLRAEDWTARNGYVATTASNTNAYASRHESHVSPKAAISHQWSPDWVLKASTGRSLRMPTAQEMFGNTALSGSTTTFLNDPNLRPERS
jgi:iron complex outermembrane receptor protein